MSSSYPCKQFNKTAGAKASQGTNAKPVVIRVLIIPAEDQGTTWDIAGLAQPRVSLYGSEASEVRGHSLLVCTYVLSKSIFVLRSTKVITGRRECSQACSGGAQTKPCGMWERCLRPTRPGTTLSAGMK